jgi:hypothetical protein|tara:strand:+ start:3394 stop:3561 length:168 start_codon:yes stop_codon:yes gene_type:complete
LLQKGISLFESRGATRRGDYDDERTRRRRRRRRRRRIVYVFASMMFSLLYTKITI